MKTIFAPKKVQVQSDACEITVPLEAFTCNGNRILTTGTTGDMVAHSTTATPELPGGDSYTSITVRGLTLQTTIPIIYYRVGRIVTVRVHAFTLVGLAGDPATIGLICALPPTAKFRPEFNSDFVLSGIAAGANEDTFGTIVVTTAGTLILTAKVPGTGFTTFAQTRDLTITYLGVA